MTIDQLTNLPDQSGDVYIPVSKGGADYKEKSPFIVLDMAASETKTFNFSNGTRFLFFTCSGSDDAKTLYIVNVSTAGVLSLYPIKAGANITITTGTRTMSVVSVNTGSMGFIVFSGKVTSA